MSNNRNDEEVEIPEGMEKHTILGLNFVVPEGIPPEFVAAMVHGMVEAGALKYDPANNTLESVGEAGKICGVDINVEADGLTVRGARRLSDDEVRNGLGVDKIDGLGDSDIQSIRSAMSGKKKR